MIVREKIHGLIRVGGLVTGLVILQQLIMKSLFGVSFDWGIVPPLALINFGVVFAWFYFKDSDKKIPLFAAIIAAFCCAIWLRAVLIYIGVFRFIAPPVIAFVERQVAVIAAFVSTPQFIPAAFAAVILLMLLPRAKTVYHRLFTSSF